MSDRGFDPLARHITALANALLPHIIPLFAIPHGKRPFLVGTALFVAQDNELFLISARHVLDRGVLPGRLYYYDKTWSLRQLIGTLVRTAPLPNGQGPDRHDVAVMRLPRDTPSIFLETLKYPVPMRSLLPFQVNRGSQYYLVTGFPRSKSHADPSTRKLKSQPQGFTVVSSSGATYKQLGLSPQRHIVMHLNISAMNFPDGSKGRIADPHGMSGSPIWLLYDEAQPNDPEITPVVGVAIEYHKAEKLLVATDIGVALDLINVSSA
jgi:hypothetical protein